MHQVPAPKNPPRGADGVEIVSSFRDIGADDATGLGTTTSSNNDPPLTVASQSELLAAINRLTDISEQLRKAVLHDPLATPTFVSNHQSASISSIRELFPMIKASTLLAIVRHELGPLDLFKLQPRCRGTTEHSRAVAEDGTLLVKSHAGSRRDYPRINSLLMPLYTYFDILVSFAATSGDAGAARLISHGGFAYCNFLSELDQTYEWDTVLEYHIDFHQQRIQEMSQGNYEGWAQPDSKLIRRHVMYASLDGSSRSPCAGTQGANGRASQKCLAFYNGTCMGSLCPNRRIYRNGKPGYDNLSCVTEKTA